MAHLRHTPVRAAAACLLLTAAPWVFAITVSWLLTESRLYWSLPPFLAAATAALILAPVSAYLVGHIAGLGWRDAAGSPWIRAMFLLVGVATSLTLSIAGLASLVLLLNPPPALSAAGLMLPPLAALYGAGRGLQRWRWTPLGRRGWRGLVFLVAAAVSFALAPSALGLLVQAKTGPAPRPWHDDPDMLGAVQHVDEAIDGMNADEISAWRREQDQPRWLGAWTANLELAQRYREEGPGPALDLVESLLLEEPFHSASLRHTDALFLALELDRDQAIRRHLLPAMQAPFTIPVSSTYGSEWRELGLRLERQGRWAEAFMVWGHWQPFSNYGGEIESFSRQREQHLLSCWWQALLAGQLPALVHHLGEAHWAPPAGWFGSS
jgi:hypothetical protein